MRLAILRRISSVFVIAFILTGVSITLLAIPKKATALSSQLIQSSVQVQNNITAASSITPMGRFEGVVSLIDDSGGGIRFEASPNLNNGGVLFASPTNGAPVIDFILKSIDGGRNWQAIQMPGSSYWTLLAISPNYVNDQTVFAALLQDGADQLCVSTDGGGHWTAIDGPYSDDWDGYRFLEISPNYATDNTIFVGWNDLGGTTGGVYSSTNQGQTWGVVTEGLALSSYSSVTDFDVSPGYPNDPTMFVATYIDGIFRSDDNGATWTLLSDPESSSTFDVTLSPDFPNDDTLFVMATGSSGGDVHRSDNRGDSWVVIKDSYNLDTLAVSPNFSQDQTVIVGQEYSGLFISEDAGDTWYPMPGLPSIGAYGRSYNVVAPYENGLLLPIASTHQTIYRYRWPSPPEVSQVFIPLEPGATSLVDKGVFLPDLEVETTWSVNENDDWLSISPITGTFPSIITLTVDAAALTGTTRTSFTLGTRWSARQVETVTVPILTMFVNSRVYLPIVVK